MPPTQPRLLLMPYLSSPQGSTGEDPSVEALTRSHPWAGGYTSSNEVILRGIQPRERLAGGLAPSGVKWINGTVALLFAEAVIPFIPPRSPVGTHEIGMAIAFRNVGKPVWAWPYWTSEPLVEAVWRQERGWSFSVGGEP